MRMMTFDSLESLNQFLSAEGLPLMNESMVNRAIENADDVDGVASFTLQGESNDQTQPSSDMDLLADFSLRQINAVIRERDAYKDMVQQERDAHEQCHAGMRLHLEAQRLQGYIEALAAGLFPGQLIESLEPSQIDALTNQAVQGLKLIDGLRQS